MEKIAVKINVTKLLKEHFFKGKVDAQTGKPNIYCDLILLPKEAPDQFGNHYSVAQSVSKEARARGEKGPFCGDAKILGEIKVEKKEEVKSMWNEEGDDIPF